MNKKAKVKAALVFSLFLLGLGGWLLHSRIHPISKDADYLIPFIAGIVSAFCIPILFCFRPTVALAYIANGFLVIIGAITMAQFSIVHFEGPVAAANIILNTTLADILILFGKFFVGKAVFDLEFLRSDADTAPMGRFFRYPNMGWWLVHLAGLTLLYTLANIYWK